MNKAAKKRFNKQVRSLHPKRCVLNAGRCVLRFDKRRRVALERKEPFVFIMRPYTKNFLNMEIACKKQIKSGYNYFIAHNYTSRIISPTTSGIPRVQMAQILAKDDRFIGNGYCQICSLCLHAHFGIAELGSKNHNVLLEIGLMFALGKPVIFTLDTGKTSIDEIPFDLDGLLLVPYENNIELEEGLKNKISVVLQELKDNKFL